MTVSRSDLLAVIARRRIWILTLASYVLAQAVVATGALIRIPLLVDDLGAAGYGRFTAVFSLWPICAVLIDGLQQATRAAVSNSSMSGAGRSATKMSEYGLRQAMFIVVTFAAPAVLAQVLLRNDLSASIHEIITSTIFVVLGICFCIPLAPSKGALDGLSKTAFTNITLASNTLIGVPILIVAFSISPTLPTAVFASVIGNSLPFVITAVYLRLSLGSGNWYFARPRKLNRLDRNLVSSMTFFAGANLLAYGFDPLIIAYTTNDVAVAEYGLASKIMMIAMFIPIGLSGLLTTRFASVRASQNIHMNVRWMGKISVSFVIIGFVVCIVSVLAAPLLGRLLSGGDIDPSIGLYMSLAVFSFLAIASCPFLSAFSTVRSSKVRAKASVTAGVTNVVLSIPLGFALGAIGPICASIIANSLMLIYLYYQSRRDLSLIYQNEAGVEDVD